MKKIKGIAILGPTGSGKTSIAIKTAQALGGEIISCDSMQIYRGMPIGTAQPTELERAMCPYHLVDFLDISEPYNALKFTTMAGNAIDQIRSRGNIPILAGGTGMYANFIICGHNNLPSDPAVFASLMQEYNQNGLGALEKELKTFDSESWENTKHNWRRLLRALEICRITGKKVSASSSRLPIEPAAEGFKQFVLIFSPEKMRERIRIRTEQMIEEGWIEEAKALFDRGLMETPTARQALGYSLIYEYLHPTPRPNNEKHLAIPDKKDLIEKIVTKTAQYAKKQRTWFRNKHKDAVFIEMDNLSADEASQLICAKIKEETND